MKAALADARCVCLRLSRVHFCSRPVPQRRRSRAAAQRVAVPLGMQAIISLMH